MTQADWHVPSHVPPELIFDFDFFEPEGVEEDVQLAWRRLHDVAPDIFWTPRNGGHWVATRGEDIKTMQTDHERFSHREHVIPHQPGTYPMLPLNLDPPQHATFRSLIAPAFMPRALTALEDKARSVAIDLIDDLAPRGECEFIEQFARVLPVTVILDLLGLPQEDRTRLIALAESVVRTPGVERRIDAQAAMNAYLAGWIDKRLAEPGDDLISHVVHAEVEGRPITTEEMFSVCHLLLLGGLDTVASMLGFICKFLAEHAEHRHQLVQEPTLMRNAIEELIRRHGIPNTARLITHDFEYKGVPFKKDELVQLPNSLFGLDDRVVSDPTCVDFRRPFPIPHAAFGNGPHTCVGAMLARREIKVFLEEWLSRIPDFTIKPGTKPVLVSGRTNSIIELHLVWKPKL